MTACNMVNDRAELLDALPQRWTASSGWGSREQRTSIARSRRRAFGNAGNPIRRDGRRPGARRKRCDEMRTRLASDSHSDPERSAKPSRGVIRVGTVVIHENRVVAAVAEQRAAEFPDR